MQSSFPNRMPAGDDVIGGEDSLSAVSWPAIFGGAIGALALMLVLVAFGTGMGFAFAPGAFASGPDGGIKHFTLIAALWLIIVQWLSSGLGGYLTGRLRTKWAGVHTHEVFFRDTAHGFLTWSATTVASALILMIAAGAGMHYHPGMESEPAAYDVDTIFRTDRPGQAVDQATRNEAGRILAKGIFDGRLSDEDEAYLGQIVAAHTGLPQADAQSKVETTVTQGHAALATMHKAAAKVSIYTLLAMLVGAFIACVAAAIGGQERDTAPRPGAVV